MRRDYRADMMVRRPVLNTKLSPPQAQPARFVRRPQLFEKLAAIAEKRVTLMIAPAGYGKTSTLVNWVLDSGGRDIAIAWLTLDDADADPVRFTNHLLASLQRNVPELEPAAGRLGEAGTDPTATGIGLLNMLSGVERPVVLILDDFHRVASPEVNELLGFLLSAASPNLHLVFSARERPDLRLGKLRALGEVSEIGVADLRFSAADARQFLKLHAGLELAESVIDQVVNRTEGWVAGVKLAAMSLSEGSVTALPQLVSGADRVSFILETSVLDEFTAELCDHVTGRGDSARILGELESRQLFLNALGEPGWFRYHQLFAELLKAMLAERQSGRAAEIHKAAARWFEQKKLLSPALRHAFKSGDLDFAADLLDRSAEALLQSGQGTTLTRYAADLPAELLAEHINLQLELVYTRTLNWQFRDARRTLHDIRKGLMNSARTAKWAARGVDLQQIQRKHIHREMQLAILMDNMVQAGGFARQWLEMEGSYSPFEDAVTQTSLIYAEREQFNCRQVVNAPQARDIFVHHGHRWGSVWHDCIIGATHAIAGNLERARTIYEGAIATAAEVDGRTSPTTAIPALHLSEILYEQNEVEAASALIAEFLPLATRTGLVDQLVAAYQTKARIAALGSQEAALKALDEGQEIALAREFDRLHAFLIADRMRILAGAGELAEARRVAIVNNLTGDVEGFFPDRGKTTIAAARAFGAACHALVQNELSDADLLLRRWVRFLEEHDCVRFAIRFQMLHAHVQLLSGDTKPAHRTLRAALQLGLRGQFIRSFADANPAVRTQIAQMTLSANAADAALVDYHRAIVATLTGAAQAPAPVIDTSEIGGPFDALNDRESEILLMVATGMMNSQIAEEVGLTLGTVKWYLQQIYNKLGVNRRSEAVFKARQLGLIS